MYIVFGLRVGTQKANEKLKVPHEKFKWDLNGFKGNEIKVCS